MNDLALPMSVLAIWTLVVLALVPIKRFRAGHQRRVHVKDFRYGESMNVPGDVALPNRNYMNLLELPVLFYAACLLAITGNRVDGVVVGLAWAFVASRVLHSAVHLTYNNVFHRGLMFGFGVVTVLLMWLRHLFGALNII